MIAEENVAPVVNLKILVKELNWLGDVVMSLPALRALRRSLPDAHVAVLVKRELAGIFDGCAWLDRVMPYTLRSGLSGLGDRGRIIEEIRGGGFDVAVVFPKSFDAALWPALAAVPRRVGFATQGRSWLLTDPVRLDTSLAERHQVHLYLALVETAFGAHGAADDHTLEVHAPHREAMRAWLAARRRRSGKLFALAPAAAYGPAKEWLPERWTALVDRLAESTGAECVLVGTPAERARCEAIAGASRAGPLVAAGETGLGELVALLSLCDGFAGNDSGAMHLAGALGLPTVGIFGSTDPSRTGPLGPRTSVLYHAIECSPCLARTCRYGHYECLKRIGVEEVLQALTHLQERNLE